MTRPACRVSFALWLFGCGPEHASAGADRGTEGTEGTEDGGDDVLPDFDFTQACPAVDTPAMAAIAPSGSYWMGPCGHVLFNPDPELPDGSARLIFPDGSIEESSVPWAFSFSPAGGRLAIRSYTDEILLTDLHTKESAVVASNGDDFGFVRSADPEQPEQLWLCSPSSGVLQLVGLDTSHPLTHSARCHSVVRSDGNSRLLFADEAGVVTVADTDSHELWATSIVDFDAEPINDWPRDDKLSVSYDGSLAVHSVVYEEFGEPDGFDYTVEARVIELDGGELLESCGTASVLQAATKHAPVFVLCDERLLVWQEDSLESLDQGVSKTWVADGAIFYIRGANPVELLRADNEATTTELIGSFAGDALAGVANQHGDAFVAVEDTGQCVDPNCTARIWMLHRWTSTAGLQGPLVSLIDGGLLSTRSILAVYDDGEVLVWGVPVDDPEEHLWLIGQNGELDFDSIIGDRVDRKWAIADGRVLLETNDPGRLAFFDRDVPELQTFIEAPYLNPTHVDARGQRLVTGQWQGDERILFWGLIPGL